MSIKTKSNISGGVAVGWFQGGQGGGTCSCSRTMLSYKSLLHCTYLCLSGSGRDLSLNLGKDEQVCDTVL